MRAQPRRVGRKEGREGADASQPLLLINHQKSLLRFMAFDPSSSFALRGRAGGGGGVGGGEVKGQRVGGGGGGGSQGPEAVEVKGGRLEATRPFGLSEHVLILSSDF